MSSSSEHQVAFFVYGTLRPDASRKVSWCKWWNEPTNCRLKSWKGYIKKCDLYMGDYPFVLLREEEEEEDWKDHICFGYIQQFEPKISNKKYNKKLEGLDDVEGYPDFYQRKVVKAYFYPSSMIPGFHKKVLTGKEKSIDVHLYHIEEVQNNPQHIKSGDFIKYKEQSKKKKKRRKKY